MRLRDHLRTDLVMADLVAPDRATALERIADFVAANEPSIDRDELQGALERREEAHSTAMGHGLALPHATLEGIEGTILGVAASRAPIEWGGEGASARLCFVLLSPPGSEATHIKLLARICRIVRIQGVADDLLEAESAEGLVRAILRHDEAHV